MSGQSAAVRGRKPPVKRKSGKKGKKPAQKSYLMLFFAAILLVVLLITFICSVAENRQRKREMASFPYQEYVVSYCREYDVDVLFVYAMMKQESSFQPDAVSVDEARGLMQITEDTYDWVAGKLGERDTTTFDDMFDPQTNIRFGVWLTAYLYREFTNPETVLAAYHAGLNITKKWLKDPAYSDNGVTLKYIPYSDTRYHVQKVMSIYEDYKEKYADEFTENISFAAKTGNVISIKNFKRGIILWKN